MPIADYVHVALYISSRHDPQVELSCGDGNKESKSSSTVLDFFFLLLDIIVLVLRSIVVLVGYMEINLAALGYNSPAVSLSRTFA
jgi:hypothetical protein